MNLSNAQLEFSTLSNSKFRGAMLSHASLFGSSLNDADFTMAVVAGAVLADITSRGFTREQLYSTASYQAKNLSGTQLWANDLSGWDFSGQDLSSAMFGFCLRGCQPGADLRNANFSFANLNGAGFFGAKLNGADLTGATILGANFRDAELTDANFSFADLRSTSDFGPSESTVLHGTILPDWTIRDLRLSDAEALVVQDVDDDGQSSIQIRGTVSFAGNSLMELLFDSGPWNSLISFEPGIPVQLGGTLELTFVEGTDVASQIGRTIHIFDWTGVEPAGEFTITSHYPWDVSELYTTGEITLLLPGDTNGDQTVDLNDLNNVRNNFGGESLGDTNNDGIVDLVDLNNVRNYFGASAPRAVPELSTGQLALVCLLCITALTTRRRRSAF